MNLTDFIIIYLACGSPFGVYYFLQSRNEAESPIIWLKIFLTFFFWIPFAFLFVRQFLVSNKNLHSNYYLTSAFEAEDEGNIYLIQKEIEKKFSESRLDFSLFEFRETLERYVGLTLANQQAFTKVSEREKEVFRIAENSNVELAANCLHRRNRKLLAFHQTEARQDFLQMIGKLSDSMPDKKNLENLAVKFVRLLKDKQAENSLEKLFAMNLQTDIAPSVLQREKDLWNPQEHKLLHAQPNSTHFQAIRATTALRRKD
jgi:hypothetical protein